REAEEEVGLANAARLLLVLGAPALLVEILLLLERLAAFAVEALVLVLEQRGITALGRPRLVQPPEQLLDRQLVTRIRGADEAVVGDPELAPGGFEARRQLVDELARSLLGGFGRPGDFLTVLVGAGQEERGIAGLAMKAGQRIRQDLLVGMAQVGQAIDV